jgi:hypothetical protein
MAADHAVARSLAKSPYYARICGGADKRCAMENEVETGPNSLLFPRFSIRTLLGVSTLCAVAFLIAGMAYRGHVWAWGITLGLASLIVTALVHAAWFGVVWLFAQLPSARARETE